MREIRKILLETSDFIRQIINPTGRTVKWARFLSNLEGSES